MTINNEAVGEPIILVETLGKFFAFINSNKNYTNEFILLKNERENEPVIFHNKSTWYNKPLTMEELETALDSCSGSSPGLDELHYSMFKELSQMQKEQILNFFNYLWENNIFPDSWRIAIVIPILKPGKEPHECSSYRPISLTSCLCKIMEKM